MRFLIFFIIIKTVYFYILYLTEEPVLADVKNPGSAFLKDKFKVIETNMSIHILYGVNKSTGMRSLNIIYAMHVYTVL